MKEITREFYEALLEVTPHDMAAPRDELTRTQDLTRVGWCKVGNHGFRPYGHCDRERLISAGVCEQHDYDLDKWRMRDQANVVRVKGKHYMIGLEYTRELDPSLTLAEIAAEAAKQPGSKQGRGFGGQVFVIRFNDGRTVVTNDLWHQGDVPELVKAMLPDNAVFVEVAL